MSGEPTRIKLIPIAPPPKTPIEMKLIDGRSDAVIVKSKHNRDVMVEHAVDMTNNHLQTIQLVATCGGSKHFCKVTMGADDGERIEPPSTQYLQQTLNIARQTAADHASWKETVREKWDGVQ